MKTVNPIESTFAERVNYKLERIGLDQQQLVDLPREELYESLEKYEATLPSVDVEQHGSSSIISVNAFESLSESHYGLSYLRLIRQLESDEVIKPGDTLYEVTSGSVGITAAVFAKLLGYKLHILVPEDLPSERINPMLEQGADVEIVSGDRYISSATDRLHEIVGELIDQDYETSLQEKKADQGQRFDYRVFVASKAEERIVFMNHPDSWIAVEGFKRIGHAVVQYANQNGIYPTHAVLAIGNWMSIFGIGQELTSHFKDLEIVGFEDANNSPNFDEFHSIPDDQRNYGKHTTFGTSYHEVDMRLAKEGRRLVSDIVTSDETSRDAVRDAFNEGRGVENTIGNSSAMALEISRGIARTISGAQIVAVRYDHIDRYDLTAI